MSRYCFLWSILNALYIYIQLTKKEEDQILEVFNEADVDKNGTISVSELKSVINKIFAMSCSFYFDDESDDEDVEMINDEDVKGH